MQLAGLYARVPRLVPPNLLQNVLSSPASLKFADITGESVMSSKHTKDIKQLRELHATLEWILALSDQIHGKDSVQAGLAHFSLAVFYSATASSAIAIQANGYESPRATSDVAFDLLATIDARDAARIFERHQHPLRWLARLHLVKQLYQSAARDEWAQRSLSDFEDQLLEVRRGREHLLRDLASAALSDEMKDWMRLQLAYVFVAQSELVRNVRERRGPGLNPEGLTSQPQSADDLKGYQLILTWAMDRPRVFHQLITERSFGVLFATLKRLSQIRHTSPGGYLLYPVSGNALGELALQVQAGATNADKLLRELEALGYRPADSAAPLNVDRP